MRWPAQQDVHAHRRPYTRAPSVLGGRDRRRRRRGRLSRVQSVQCAVHDYRRRRHLSARLLRFRSGLDATLFALPIRDLFRPVLRELALVRPPSTPVRLSCFLFWFFSRKKKFVRSFICRPLTAIFPRARVRSAVASVTTVGGCCPRASRCIAVGPRPAALVVFVVIAVVSDTPSRMDHAKTSESF